MIRQTFILDGYGWRVKVYYAVDCYYVDEIMDELERIGCSGRKLRMAYENMSSCSLNTGLTYSNFRRKETVMVIALTSGPEEFYNSLNHEKKHLEAHISQVFGLDDNGEDAAYLSGDIAEAMYDKAKYFLCSCRCCKDKVKHLID